MSLEIRTWLSTSLLNYLCKSYLEVCILKAFRAFKDQKISFVFQRTIHKSKSSHEIQRLGEIWDHQWEQSVTQLEYSVYFHWPGVPLWNPIWHHILKGWNWRRFNWFSVLVLVHSSISGSQFVHSVLGPWNFSTIKQKWCLIQWSMTLKTCKRI